MLKGRNSGSSEVAEQIDDKPINTDTWADGETATIR